MLRFGRSYKEERIIYLALERISLLSKILEKLNFLIWHHVAVHLSHPSVSWLSGFFRSTKIPLMFGCMLVSCQTWAELVHASFPPPPPISSNFFRKKEGSWWMLEMRMGQRGRRAPAPRNPWCPLAADSVLARVRPAHAAHREQATRRHCLLAPEMVSCHPGQSLSCCHGRRLSWCLHSSSCCYVVIYFARHSSSSPGALKRLPIHTPHDVRCMRRSKQVAASVCWCGRYDQDWFSDSEELDKVAIQV